MEMLTVDQFEEFFRSLHDYDPFPWQSMLARQVASDGWPDLIDLPTAHGKTACIDIGVFAIALGLPAPRRIWLVVDRRIVVDEAYRRARLIAEKLAGARSGILGTVAAGLRSVAGSVPLQVSRLRGGVPRSIAWAGNPAQPAVITSTVDQIGSKILFRGYGVSDAAKPIHAALAGNDSLILLDEAHLATPFFQTVMAVERFRRTPWASEPLATPFKLVVMSATPPAGESAHELKKFPSDQQRREAISHPKLDERRAVRKPTELAVAKKPKTSKALEASVEDELVLDAADRAAKFAAAGRRRIAVMVNRVKTAREIAAVLQRLAPGDSTDIVLLTGRVRPVDRDELIKRYEPALRAGSAVDLASPIIVVTTQCLEVGADFSFDALITECASLDALRQRFGRLARLGAPTDATGVILIRKQEAVPDEKLVEGEPADPIYGDALARTWNWMTSGGETSIDMGIDALDQKLPTDLTPYRGPQLDAPILLPAYLDLLCQTSPRPAVDPDVALFLHGVPPSGQRPIPQVRLVWRKELQEAGEAGNDLWEELVKGLPPLTGEMLAIPLWECRRLLLGESAVRNESDADVEGGFEPGEGGSPKTETASTVQRYIIWRGRDRCCVSTTPKDLQPEDVVVLPGTPDSPSYKALVSYEWASPDVYEPAYQTAHGVIRKRVPRSISGDKELDPQEIIGALTASVIPENLPFFRNPRFAKYADGFFHVTGRVRPAPVDRWDSDSDEDDLLYGDPAGRNGEGPSKDHDSRSLDGHTSEVVAAVRQLQRTVPERFHHLLQSAAELHDFGKADPRFQYLLSHGRLPDPTRLRAKSDFRLSPAQEKQLHSVAKLPEGFRHELLSMQIVAADSSRNANPLRDLLLHLIASHHGRCRPFAPVVTDDSPPTVTVGGHRLEAADRNTIPPHHLASDVAERFWALTRRYGWWGVAYLESILRCADMHASAFAEVGLRR